MTKGGITVVYFKRLLAVAAGSVLFLVPSTAASAGLIGNVNVNPNLNVSSNDVTVSSNDCNVNLTLGGISSCKE